MSWSSQSIRSRFTQFFKDKEHKAVASAPMVIKNDPSLMFTNAGMNQFKDIFIGNKEAKAPRLVNSQKCLRVSGKHNDLEEVGVDTYHHTMFEMLGNWSFGDYFKEEAIVWAWEFLTRELEIDEKLLYVTVFEGDKEDKLELDQEAVDHWKKHVAEERILAFGKKDNFWEMGEVGPCGPCSEIHIDLRSEEEKKKEPGKHLVNQDHPQVIEIWNLVFIQYQRSKSGELSLLPNKHVDTGMGLERLCRVLQNKDSNYDIDLFQGIISHSEKLSGLEYGKDEEKDIAFRVIADHIRPVCFSIAEGQLPSNTGPGYVIRRILRRAVRYAYSKLEVKDAFLYKLIDDVVSSFADAYPELEKNKSLIKKVVHEEEESFLRTLSQGLKKIDELIKKGKVSGKEAFELYDTYGFPIDLTQLIAREHDIDVDLEEFNEELNKQKERSRSSAQKDQSDWTVLHEEEDSNFLGYDQLETKARLLRYREVKEKKRSYYQLVFNQTPFYPEGGGQVGDKGILRSNNDAQVDIWDTKKENDTILHFCNELPELESSGELLLQVRSGRRHETAKNHSATHLLHYVLREILGSHVEQKGSLVHPDYLRFDFSHFEKIDDEKLKSIENRVNELIREGIDIDEKRSIALEEARAAGAMSLFGEKYGDQVRMISFGPSKELCGGIHVSNTRDIGYFILEAESSIASGVRRIEALTGEKAFNRISGDLELIKELNRSLNKPKDLLSAVNDLKTKLKEQEKEIESLKSAQLKHLSSELEDKFEEIGKYAVLTEKLQIDPKEIRNLGFQLKDGAHSRFIVLASAAGKKVSLSVFLSRDLVDAGLDARNILNEIAPLINGRGGGQAFFATAGGSDAAGIGSAFDKAKTLL